MLQTLETEMSEHGGSLKGFIEVSTALCPVDHSSVSRRGLRNAISQAEALSSRLIWLSVIPEVTCKRTPVTWLPAIPEVGETTDVKAEYQAQWREKLDRFTASMDLDGVAHTQVLERDVPHERIIAVVQKHSTELRRFLTDQEFP